MGDAFRALTDSELELLSGCISDERFGRGLQYASCALFLFDYALTVHKEARFYWWTRRATLSAVAFVIARYSAMACTIITLLPNISVSLDGTTTILRLIAIVLSEFIVAVRTWAIWGRNRKIMYTLAAFSVSAVIPAAIIVSQSVKTNQVVPLIPSVSLEICTVMIGNVIKDAWVVPYVLTIIYEIVTLSLSLIRITRWRRSIPESMRAPILDTLWRDGVLYFSFMLVLGFMNIGLVTNPDALQMRAGGAQLQAVLHSMLSTRIVLHLADSQNPRDITAPGCSVYTTGTDIQFTTQISISDEDGTTHIPASRTWRGALEEG